MWETYTKAITVCKVTFQFFKPEIVFKVNCHYLLFVCVCGEGGIRSTQALTCYASAILPNYTPALAFTYLRTSW